MVNALQLDQPAARIGRELLESRKDLHKMILSRYRRMPSKILWRVSDIIIKFPNHFLTLTTIVNPKRTPKPGSRPGHIDGRCMTHADLMYPVLRQSVMCRRVGRVKDELLTFKFNMAVLYSSCTLAASVHVYGFRRSCTKPVHPNSSSDMEN